MGIINIKYQKKYRRTVGKTNFDYLSLVSCECPLHEGNVERLIPNSWAVKGVGVKYCNKCRYTENLPKISPKIRSLKTRQKISQSLTGRKQSMETRLKLVKSLPRGIKHHNYNSNLTEEDRLKEKGRNKTTEYIMWKTNVFQRDNYTCQIIGDKGNYDIVAHHLQGWHWYKEGRYDVNNGITLSKEIHNIFHMIYGIRNNTKEQFNEFLKYCKFIFI